MNAKKNESFKYTLKMFLQYKLKWKDKTWQILLDFREVPRQHRQTGGSTSSGPEVWRSAATACTSWGPLGPAPGGTPAVGGAWELARQSECGVRTTRGARGVPAESEQRQRFLNTGHQERFPLRIRSMHKLGRNSTSSKYLNMTQIWCRIRFVIYFL